MERYSRIFGRGDEDATAQVLAHRPELLNERGSDGCTVLHWVCHKGYAKISAQLHYAAQGGHEAIVTQLLVHTSRDVLVRANNSRLTVLDYALENGHDKIVGQLLEHCPELIETETLHGFNVAVSKGYDKAVAQVLKCNREPKSLSVFRHGLLSAVVKGHDNIVALLLDYDPSSLDATDSLRNSALHMAAQNGHEKVVAQLLACSPKLIDAVNLYGQTVLHSATFSESDQVLARLLACKPELIDALSLDRDTPLQYALRQYSTIKAIEFLLAAKPEQALHIDEKGNTLLHRAIRGCRRQNVKLMEKLWRMNPAAVRVADHENLTPFQLAVTFSLWGLVELFQWEFSLDEIENTFARCACSLERVRPAIDKQCESLLVGVLGQDLTCVVYQYLGFERKNNKRKA